MLDFNACGGTYFMRNLRRVLQLEIVFKVIAFGKSY